MLNFLSFPNSSRNKKFSLLILNRLLSLSYKNTRTEILVQKIRGFLFCRGRAEFGALTFTMKLLLISAVLLSITNAGVYGADPDPVMDYPKGLKNFTLRDIFTNGHVTRDSGGVRAATSGPNAHFPAARSQGLEIVRFKMVPCGVNPPHTHPRATEMLTLISGGPIQVGFVDTDGKAFIDILHPGDVTVFPRGLMHFEMNVGGEEAQYISALNSQNAGVLTASEGILKFPLRSVATAFNITIEEVRELQSVIYPYGIGLKRTSKSGCVPGRDVTVDY